MYYLSASKIRKDIKSNEIGRHIPMHIKWVKGMIAEGTVLQAGKWGQGGGIIIMEAGEIEEAEGIIRKDPLIKAGLVTYEIGEFFPDVKFQ